MIKQKKKMSIVIGSILLVVILAIMSAVLITKMSSGGGQNIQDLLDLGQKYLNELDYEAAIVVFDEAIALDPKCEEAYMGKATAQYSLGLYQDAIDTLKEGIKVVDESSELEEFLKKIEDELRDTEETIIQEEIVVPDMAEDQRTLNYFYIVRRTDTEDPTIQLEVLGDENSDTQYTWTSSNDECASVSEDGMVTCRPMEGNANIIVTDGNWSDTCTVMVADWGAESLAVRVPLGENGESGGENSVSFWISKNEDKIIIDNGITDNGFPEYVYYSGDIIIPEQITYQGIDLPVTSVALKTFEWSQDMNTIRLPASAEIDLNDQDDIRNPFLYCKSLKEVMVDEENESIKSVEGVLYSKDGKTLMAYPASREGNSYTIPKQVENILPGAFAGCVYLEEILVEAGNTRYESVDGVLVDKSTHTLLAYPNGKKESDYSVPEGVQVIGANAFYNSPLKIIECGSDVSSIEDKAFLDCAELTEVRGMEQVQKITFGMFQGCSNLKWIGGAGNVEVFLFNYDDNLIKLANLDKMVNVETLVVDISAIQDLNDIGNLSKLQVINIWDHDGKIQDLSWLEGLDQLENLSLSVDKFDITDLSPLMDLKNIRYINIHSFHSTDGAGLEENIVDQIEKLQEEKPDCNINID